MSTLPQPPDQLSIIPSGPGSDKAFDKWQNALLRESELRKGRTYWMPRHRIFWEFWGNHLRPDTRFDYHGTNGGWTIEINRPTSTGSHRTSAIAKQPDGSIWLIRQGWLQKNSDTLRLIKGAEFQIGTGLRSIPTKAWKGPDNREWFAVARLDQSPEIIVDQTYRFIARCASARARYSNEIEPSDTVVLDALFAEGESGGYIDLPGRPAISAKKAFKLQGAVWEAMQIALESRGIKLQKPKHGSGYTVDASFDNGNECFLLEIKTDISASSIYEGIGQLMIYAKLIPSLEKHTPVLMLPARPHKSLQSAIRSLGVEIVTYEINQKSKPPEIKLDETMLARFTS